MPLEQQSTSDLAGTRSDLFQNSILPDRLELLDNYPNPFNPETEIRFQLPESGYVTVHVFNSRGQKIKTLVDSYMPAGFHSVHWDGTDHKGSHVSSGLYLYKLQAGGRRLVKTMTLLR